MIDSYNRNIDYLRISLTDKCNLRCKYCMPKDGIKHLEHKDIMTLEEIFRVVKIMSEIGIKRVRLTGGEPLVRKNISKLISDIKMLPDIERISMTTNGVLLPLHIKKIVQAGLDDVNISLDSINPNNYKEITGKNELDNVIKAIDLSVEYGLKPKINCVPIKGLNQDDLINVAKLAMEKEVDVRYIELMPTNYSKEYSGIATKDILELLESVYGKSEKLALKKYEGPAIYYRFKNFKGRIGFISPISDIFCEYCNRVRLTSTGKLKLCLHNNIEVDLLQEIRSGADDKIIKELILKSIALKPLKHTLNKESADTNMFQIGG